MDRAIEAAADQISGFAGRALHVESFFDEKTFTYSHVAHDPVTGAAVIIDSVLDFDAAAGRTTVASADNILRYVRRHELVVEWILETHVHADHLSAAPYLKKHLGGRLAIGKAILAMQTTFGELFNTGNEFVRDGSQFDRLFEDGDRFSVGSIEAAVLHLPGHTPADLAYVIGNVIFVGDTLFMPDYGTSRTDFPGGDARMLYRSIRRLLSLPPETRLFLCHDYKAPGRTEFCSETTIAEERAGNIHIHDGIDEQSFVTMREARDRSLGMPALFLPAIQVNIRAGNLPAPESNGIRYLKIPLDEF